jgi:type II secretory pathway pseudopilin PulG
VQGLRQRLRREDGFTLIVAMLGLLIVGLVSFGAYTAVMADNGVGNRAKDQKLAFTAADAGLQWYQAQLAADPNYWTKCTNVPGLTDMGGSSPVNQAWNGAGNDPRNWRTIPGSTQQYTVELLPVSPATSCDPTTITTATSTMLDPATRTFRVRISGRSRAPVAGCGVGAAPACPKVRSIVGTFRRRSFLDYLYYSNYEELDPKLQTFGWGYPGATSSTVDPVAWAQSNCNKHEWEGRSAAAWPAPNAATATLTYHGTNYNNLSGKKCATLQFAGTDAVNGPFHTEDTITICGTPTFGRNVADAIEIANGAPDTYQSWVAADPAAGGPCPGITSNFTPAGAANLAAPPLPMPSSNTAIKNVAGATYNGPTTIVLSGSTMSVNGGAYTAVPANGVIYVNTNGACAGYKPTDPYSTSGNTGCGNLTISGSYSVPLTFGAANDIIINGDLTNSTQNAVLGLVANNFVRVYHQVATPPADYTGTPPVSANSACANTSANQNAAGTKSSYTIKAAIIALNDSFVVDNFMCGDPLTSLNVTGAIAQSYRGPVGTGGATITHGYAKSYTYDDRLHSSTPPQFLDPASASWNIARVTEQVPATG